MNFVSFNEFYQDIAAWERQLPEFDAVVGVPRSGTIPAAYISLRRNIRLVEFTEFVRNPDTSIERALLRKSNPIVRPGVPVGNRLLVVDDASSDNSVTFNQLRELMRVKNKTLEITYGAVYRAERSLVDLSYRQIPQPRLFGWNWFRHSQLSNAMLDMDGVICEDWIGKPEIDGDEEFLRHLNYASPLYVPQRPILAVVTSRIEKNRELTARWLRQHNVRYRHLIMHPAETPQARQKARDHGQRKALTYLKNDEATLFIESDVRQAKEIFEISKKPVLCIDTMELFK